MLLDPKFPISANATATTVPSRSIRRAHSDFRALTCTIHFITRCYRNGINPTAALSTRNFFVRLGLTLSREESQANVQAKWEVACSSLSWPLHCNSETNLLSGLTNYGEQVLVKQLILIQLHNKSALIWKQKFRLRYQNCPPF